MLFILSFFLIMKTKYICPKCGCGEYEEEQIRTSGGGWSSVFDFENKKFITISCTNCGFTELFKQKPSTGQIIADLFVN